MNRLAEMIKLIPKTLAASNRPAKLVEQRQQRLAELEYQMTNFCEWCGGLPHGLPPQVYDDKTECECEE